MLKKIVIITAAATAAGALSFGAVGLAGAASPPSSNPPTRSAQTPASPIPKTGRNFNCANAGKVLARIQKVEGQIAAGLPTLTAAEATATANGNTTRATKIQNRIARLESSTFKARLDKVSQRIEAKCNVAAPTA